MKINLPKTCQRFFPQLILTALVSAASLLLLVLPGCDQGPESPRGFSLPKGDAELGKAVFIKYRCLACHSIEGITDDSVSKELTASVPLGGEVSRTKTYADLVTSIINPSHRIAKVYMSGLVNEDGSSKMRNYNDVMTVTELTNLVTFLQPHFNVAVYDETFYSVYP